MYQSSGPKRHSVLLSFSSFFCCSDFGPKEQVYTYNLSLENTPRPSIGVVRVHNHARDDALRTVHLDIRQFLATHFAEPEPPQGGDSLLQPQKTFQEVLRGFLFLDEHVRLTALAFFGTMKAKYPSRFFPEYTDQDPANLLAVASSPSACARRCGLGGRPSSFSGSWRDWPEYLPAWAPIPGRMSP